MKIEYVTGDLFDTDCRVIVHGCNTHGVMGSGVAKLIREKYPSAYEVYRAEYEVAGLTLGAVQAVGTKGKTIVNAMTQENYGKSGDRYVSYDAVAETMSKIQTMFPSERVAMPQIGAGLGGGDWNVISAIIESEAKTFQPVVYILG